MIKTCSVRKDFDDICAVGNLSLEIEDAQVFGLIGTNGAGKSTLLRMIAGILKPDEGSITIDDRPVYDNPDAKKDVFFISDEPYFFPNANAADMASWYANTYETFDQNRFHELMKDFGLDEKRSIHGYSKGMKKQLSIALGIAAGTRYILCDETFDGLDPVMRQGVKSLIAGEMDSRGLTPVIASHNLRELEDLCDHVGLLHQGGLLLSEDLAEMKLGIQKVQCVFASESAEHTALATMNIVQDERRGRMHTLVVRGERDAILEAFRGVETIYFEVVPLTLEEIFITETEVVGYDFKKYLL